MMIGVNAMGQESLRQDTVNYIGTRNWLRNCHKRSSCEAHRDNFLAQRDAEVVCKLHFASMIAKDRWVLALWRTALLSVSALYLCSY